MAQEIDRKFLGKSDIYKVDAFKATQIMHGYLSSIPERVVRVRIKGDEAFITIKE
jgi:adenylate cyclase